MYLPEQLAVLGVTAHAVLVGVAPAQRTPDATLGVAAHPIGDARFWHVGKDLVVANLSLLDVQVEDPNVRRIVRPVGKSGVDDVEFLLVGRQRDAIGLHEIVDDDPDLAGFRIDPVDIVLVLFGLGLDALIIAADAVDRIGEPDRPIRRDDRVVWRVQLLAIVLVGDDRDRAVVLGAGDTPAGVLAGDQATFAIDGVAVRVHRGLAVDAEVPIILREAHDAVVGN